MAQVPPSRNTPHELDMIMAQIEENRRVNQQRHDENIERLDDIVSAMKVDRETNADFKRTYEEMLKAQKRNNEQWDDIKRELIKKSVTGALVWFVGLLSVALWFYLKSVLK